MELKLWKIAIPLYVILFLILIDSILAPFLESKMLGESYYFYAILRNFCHQLPTRCIWIFGSNMGLCSRCFGIYLGLFLIGILLGWKGINRFFWRSAIILMLPMIIDGITQLKGLRVSNNYIRFVTGFMAGIGWGMILFPVYFRLVIWIIKIFKRGGDRKIIYRKSFEKSKN
jgi:uncharacterized membrane protein